MFLAIPFRVIRFLTALALVSLFLQPLNSPAQGAESPRTIACASKQIASKYRQGVFDETNVVMIVRKISDPRHLQMLRTKRIYVKKVFSTGLGSGICVLVLLPISRKQFLDIETRDEISLGHSGMVRFHIYPVLDRVRLTSHRCPTCTTMTMEPAP